MSRWIFEAGPACWQIKVWDPSERKAFVEAEFESRNAAWVYIIKGMRLA